MLFQTSGVFNLFKRYDAKDVDAPSHCFGFPCPLALHIYSGEFSDQSFNGYYISDHIRKSATYLDTKTRPLSLKRTEFSFCSEPSVQVADVQALIEAALSVE